MKNELLNGYVKLHPETASRSRNSKLPDIRHGRNILPKKSWKCVRNGSGIERNGFDNE